MAVQRRTEEEQELNLTPIMNLVTILIPFLIMAAQFVNLSVIDSTLPAIGPPQPVEEQEDEEPPLNLSLAVTDAGITVLGADAVLNPDGGGDAAPAEGEERPPTVPCKSGGECTGLEDYDWPELARILNLIKDRYPDDENVIIVPDSDMRYEIIVKTMDVARDDPENKDADDKSRALFPFVVIAGGAM